MRPKRISPQASAALSRSERRRLILMGVGVVALAIGYFVARHQERGYREAERANLPTGAGAVEETVLVPVFDHPELLERVVDAEPAQRVVLDAQALDAVLAFARLFSPRHFEAYGLHELDAAARETLFAAPREHRLEAYRARGTIVALRERGRSTGNERFAGTLLQEDGSPVHFALATAPEGTAVGQFVRVDGFFLKLYSTEGPDGWRTGPLLVGRRPVPSYPALGPDAMASLDETLASVEDDTLERRSGLPFDAKWRLLAHAEAPAPPVDWEAAPELDGEWIQRIFADGADFRGKPFRVGISRNMACWTETAGENPLRLDEITVGWIGNQYWKGQVPVIHFLLPAARPELSERDGAARLVTARGFFFKNMSYEKPSGDLGRVPVFVMEDVEIFTPPPDFLTRNIMWIVLGITAALASLIWFLLGRDKRKSEELQAELVRRRRARRGKLAESP